MLKLLITNWKMLKLTDNLFNSQLSIPSCFVPPVQVHIQANQRQNAFTLTLINFGVVFSSEKIFSQKKNFFSKEFKKVMLSCVCFFFIPSVPCILFWQCCHAKPSSNKKVFWKKKLITIFCKVISSFYARDNRQKLAYRW